MQVPLCSFCGKAEQSVETLIVGPPLFIHQQSVDSGEGLVRGPRVYICNECVAHCVGILEGERDRRRSGAEGR